AARPGAGGGAPAAGAAHVVDADLRAVERVRAALAGVDAATDPNPLLGCREDLVVADPGVLEQVLLVRGDHGLLPALAGERPDRLDVLPDRDVHVLGRGRVTGPARMLGHEPCLLRRERGG